MQTYDIREFIVRTSVVVCSSIAVAELNTTECVYGMQFLMHFYYYYYSHFDFSELD